MRYNHRHLKRARREAGLELDEAARRMNTSRHHLELLEAGVSVPRADTLAKIATAYGKTPDFFFDVKDAA